MTDPSLGSDAVVKKGTTEIGYATGITSGINIDLIKEYIIGQANPGVLRSGPQTYPLRIDKMMLDTEFANHVLNGDSVSFEFSPAGTGTGANNPKITMTGVTLTSWEMTIRAEGVVMESLSGEGKVLTLGEW